MNEISRYPLTLLDNEKLISIIFISSDESIEYPLICKNTENFKTLENLFCIKYPEYTNKKNDFYVNGRMIDKQKNLKKNNIND